jgi:hypothetical protein
MKFRAIALVLQAALVLAGVPAGAKIIPAESSVDKGSSAYRRFRDWVDESVSHPPGYGFSARDAALLGRLSGEKKYCELAVRLADEQVTRAEAAIAKGEAPEVAGDSYLEIGLRIADVALAYDVCQSETSPEQRNRWRAYAERTLENVWNPLAAKWGDKAAPWSGWAVDDPGNNYYYSFLEATMYWGLATDSPHWLSLLRDEKLPAVLAYFAKVPGGGSREGTGYGTSLGRLFALYNLWRDSTGADLAAADPHVADTIAYWVHATVPTLDRFAPIGDQARVSIPELYDYQRCLMLEARRFTQDPRAQNLAEWWLHHISVREMTAGFNYRCGLLPAGHDAPAPTEHVYYASGTGQLFARSDWSRNAMWLNFSAGDYSQSHAHQDQGSFTLFAGDWLAVSENIWTHSGIHQESETNNVVRFVANGRDIPQQSPSLSTMTITSQDAATGEVHATSNLTSAYPRRAGIESWWRSIDFVDRSLTVHDTYTVRPNVEAIFQLNVPTKPTVNGQEIEAGRLKIEVIKPENARISVLDWSSRGAEFTSGWRIDIAGGDREFVVKLSDQKKR